MSESRTEERAMKTWEEMAPRERDCEVGRLVMGDDIVCVAAPDDYQVRSDRGGGGLIATWPVPRFSTDATADYQVLEKVRSEWAYSSENHERFERFEEQLKQIWIQRDEKQTDYSVGQVSGHRLLATLYIVGDYSRAAYSVVREEAGQ